MVITRRSMLQALPAAAALPVSAFAQPAWPTRPIRLVVPFTAAGTTDILARMLAERISATLGQPVIADNRPGAGGNIGAEVVAKAEPDGYTVIFGTIATGASGYALYRHLSFGPSDFTAVGLMAKVPNVIIARKNLPAKTLAEVIALAKEKPGALTYGSAGAGVSPQLAFELMRSQAGIEVIHVPFRGAAPMATEVLAGRIDLGADNLSSSIENIRTGGVLGIAVSGAQRSPALPDVPTVAETLPGFEATAWFGVQAPAKTPRPIVEKMSAAIDAAVKEPAMRAKIAEQGGEAVGGSPESFQRFIDREVDKWGKLIRDINLRLD